MKKKLFVLLSSLFCLSVLWGGDKVTTTDAEKLPVAARNFIASNFSDTRISIIKIDKEHVGGTSYDVLLENGYNLEFNNKGAWTEIDGGVNSLSETLIPDPVVLCVKRHFPGYAVASMEREKKRINVKLTNGTELEFNLKGELIELDKD